MYLSFSILGAMDAMMRWSGQRIHVEIVQRHNIYSINELCWKCEIN